MKTPFRPMRSRFTRLLASVLVAASLLVNGFAAAEAAAMAVGKDCCAEMMGKGKHATATPAAHKGCPPSASDGCDDQCQMRCQVNNALPALALTLPAMIRPQTILPLPEIAAWASPEPAPGLRPPIST